MARPESGPAAAVMRHACPHVAGVRCLRTLLAIASLALGAIACAHAAATAANAPIIAGGAGSVVPVSHWFIQSSANAQQSGDIISKPGYSTKDWYRVSGTATVLAGLLGDDEYPDVFHGMNLLGVEVPNTDHHRFEIPWWYRTEFRIPDAPGALHTFIRVNGIIPRADLWLNGRQIADATRIDGAYTTHEIEVTALLRPGVNVLAVRVQPASPQRDLSVGWIDWNPSPPDNNMGIWRAVEIVRSGPVSLHDLHIASKLALPGLGAADLTLAVTARNDSDAPQDIVVAGTVAGVSLRRAVQLPAHAARTLSFDPATDPALRLDHPRVWWPAGWGAQPLYDATLTVAAGGAVSDRAATTFGIREVQSRLTRQGYRQFVINGKPLLIRGAGWSPDMFLRDDPARLAAPFDAIRNLGLNAIRTEGKLERQDFYDLADRDGILILAGWECCDKWEAWAKTGGAPWTPADLKVAGESMASEARRLRDHPSVIAFLIGSDNAPPPDIAQVYVDALHAADWPDPVISAASAQATPVAGPSGMKMSGPYAWVPPDYWYADKLGGAFGFNSETSAGISIPRLASLRAMLTPRELDALWQDPGAKQFHAAPFWSPFSSLKRFDTALAQRYGAPTSLADYVEKAQLMNYAAARAQFEAYNARMDATHPSTGVIYWMLTNGWPSLHWHLLGYDLDPAGAYFGAQQANEPVHIQYSYDDRGIVVVNHTLQPRPGLTARVRVRGLDGRVRFERTLTRIDLAPNRATRIATIPALRDLSPTYFIELDLSGTGGDALSRNVYWVSTRPDELRWADSNWYMTPVSRHADFTALQSLPQVTANAIAHTTREGDNAATTVTLSVPTDSRAVALFLHLSLLAGDGTRILPVAWSGNDVTLWPGESVTLTARYGVPRGVAPRVEVGGWNAARTTISTDPQSPDRAVTAPAAMR